MAPSPAGVARRKEILYLKSSPASSPGPEPRAPADLELTGLAGLYENLHRVNCCVAERLREAGRTDSAVNALVILDVYAHAVPESLAATLEELRGLFSACLP